MLLTVEYNPDGIVEVFMDEEGREALLFYLKRLSTGNHDHLMTPSWAGTELTEDPQNPKNKLINKVNLFLIRDEISN